MERDRDENEPLDDDWLRRQLSAYARSEPDATRMDEWERLGLSLLGSPSIDVTTSQPPVPRKRTSRSVRRWLAVASAVTLAILVLVASLEQTAYSYASMIQAMCEQPWVETARDTSNKQHGWLSFSRMKVVVQSGSHVRYEDLRSGIVDDYHEDENLVYRSESPVKTQAVPSAVLFRLLQLLQSFDDHEEGDDDVEDSSEPSGFEASDWEHPIHETWRKVTDARGRWIELTVTFATDQSKESHDSFRQLIFLLHPETHLPHTCRIVGVESGNEALVRFGYPERAASIVGVDGSAPADVPRRVRRAPSVDRIIRAEVPQPAQREPEEAEPAPTPLSLAPFVRSSIVLTPHEMATRIDQILFNEWNQAGIVPAAATEDHEFLRRIYLDLVGRIPSVHEARTFLDDRSENRRAMLAERLLMSWDYATHSASRWRAMLVPNVNRLEVLPRIEQLELWIAEQIAAGQRYDMIVSDLLLARGRLADSGAIQFYALSKLQPTELATVTARAFCGVQLDCAQCHDHPYQPWKQHDYWGLAAFFARISQPQANMEMANDVLMVADIDTGEVVIPETDRVARPRFLDGKPFHDASASGGATSRRAALVEWLRAKDNPFFARAAVNRVWSQLMGRGLIEPVDDITSGRAPVAHELIDELANYFVAHDFDLRLLMQAIVQSRAYQLSSRYDGDQRSLAESYFAVMTIKPLKAAQFYDCLTLATMSNETMSRERNEGTTDDIGLVRFGNGARQAFLNVFGGEYTETGGQQTGITQALELIQGRAISNFSDENASPILQALRAPFLTTDQRLETLFLATLSRRPTADERAHWLSLLEKEPNESAQFEILADLLWALLNSAEFGLNS